MAAAAPDHDNNPRAAAPLLSRLVGQRYLQYFPSLAQLTGSIKATLMLGHALSWTRHYARTEPDRDGWFWQTTEEWRNATGLSRHEQINARSRLRSLGVLEEQGRGMPRRTWFRLNLDAIAEALGRQIGRAVRQWSWSEAVVRTLLGRPVACYKPFAEAAGSVAGGLYLSWLCANLRHQPVYAEASRLRHVVASADDDDVGPCVIWLDLAMQDTQHALHIRRWQMEGARTTLLHAGLITECWSTGVPARRLTQVNIDAVAAALDGAVRAHEICPAEPENRPQSQQRQGMYGNANPACAKADDWNGGIVHSRLRESGQQGCAKADAMSSGKPQPLYGFTSSTQLPTETVEVDSTNVPAQVSRSGSSNRKETQGRAPFELPDSLGATERQSAIQVLQRLGDTALAQTVADEWASQLALGHVRAPINYLAGLVGRAQCGLFVPARALNRSRKRDATAALEAARRQLPEGMRLEASDRPAPSENSFQERTQPSAAVRDQLDELRRRMRCVTTR